MRLGCPRACLRLCVLQYFIKKTIVTTLLLSQSLLPSKLNSVSSCFIDSQIRWWNKSKLFIKRMKDVPLPHGGCYWLRQVIHVGAECFKSLGSICDRRGDTQSPHISVPLKLIISRRWRRRLGIQPTPPLKNTSANPTGVAACVWMTPLGGERGT